MSRLYRIHTLRDFDEFYAAPDGGYASAQDYYVRTGAQGVIGAIRALTLDGKAFFFGAAEIIRGNRGGR